jgi:hypothetical protein
VWRSSDEAVLRVVPLAGRTGVAEADTLAARALRVRVEARRAGAATLEVALDARGGSAAPALASLRRVVAPLRVTPLGWPAALASGASDTLRVEVRDVRGRVRTDQTLAWRSSDETRLRIVPVAATGAADDALAVRGYKVRVVALADGPAAITVTPEAALTDSAAATRVAFAVAPIGIAPTRGRDTLTVTEVDTLQVRLASTVVDSIGAARFEWTTSNPAVLTLAQLPLATGDPAADTLAVRQARMRATARAPGAVTVTARLRPAGGERRSSAAGR